MARVKICRKPDCHNTTPYEQDNSYCEIHKAMYRPKPEFKPKSSYERKRQQREYNANKRDKEANEFYHNKTWKHLSQQDSSNKLCSHASVVDVQVQPKVI
ncbi:hypothetical protein [Leuconostoc sp. UCMA20149]|uniref:hypothetical protein n=1 Tax=Leuconostoc sp. UCMA20149 TaxID=2583528 RepID=UPI0025B03B3C|nr:hypothetical protein [Leuconostoc sp. UCMA20149]